MAIASRVKCPKCGDVLNIYADVPCPKCGQPLQNQNSGMILMYRMGSFFGVAGGFGIYINGEPMGHIGNKETLRIPLPYGTYTVHIAVGMSRKCEDATVTLSPESPDSYMKVSIKPGAWTNSFRATVVSREEMPELP